MWQQGSIVVFVTGCSRGGGVVGLLFCFTFGNASMLISIYFVLLPVNREARLRVIHPLARGWIGWLLVVLVWGATMQQCRAIEVGWLQSRSKCVSKEQHRWHGSNTALYVMDDVVGFLLFASTAVLWGIQTVGFLKAACHQQAKAKLWKHRLAHSCRGLPFVFLLL